MCESSALCLCDDLMSGSRWSPRSEIGAFCRRKMTQCRAGSRPCVPHGGDAAAGDDVRADQLLGPARRAVWRVRSYRAGKYPQSAMHKGSRPDHITAQVILSSDATHHEIMSVTIGSFHCRIPCTSCRRGRRGTWASRTASRSRASSRRWPSSAAATCSACRSRCAPLAPRLLLCLAVSRVVLLAASQLKQAVLHFSVCQHRHAHLASGCGGMTLIEVALLLCVIDMSLPD